MVVFSRHALRHIDHATDIFVPRPQGALSDSTIPKKVSKGRFVERINARNLSTTATPLMRYVSQLRRKHTSLESLCCSEAVDIQDDECLQRCCGTAS